MKDAIQIDIFCEFHKVDIQLVYSIIDNGFIEVHQENKVVFIPASSIENLERCIRLYNDLGVNMAGLEVITHMRTKILELRERLGQIDHVKHHFLNSDVIDDEDDLI